MKSIDIRYKQQRETQNILPLPPSKGGQLRYTALPQGILLWRRCPKGGGGRLEPL